MSCVISHPFPIFSVIRRSSEPPPSSRGRGEQPRRAADSHLTRPGAHRRHSKLFRASGAEDDHTSFSPVCPPPAPPPAARRRVRKRGGGGEGRRGTSKRELERLRWVTHSRQVYLDAQAQRRGRFRLQAGGDYMPHYNATHYRLWQINYMPLS